MKHSNDVLRIATTGLALCGLLLPGGRASAEQFAPAPVNPGEFYIGAGVSYGKVSGSEYKAHELYPILPDRGCCWITNPSGNLITHSTSSDDVVLPTFHIGYAFTDNFGDGLLRLELSGEAYKREESSYTSSVTVPADDFAVVIPIDGQDNEDGSLPDNVPDDDQETLYGYAYTGSFWDNQFDVSEASVTTDLTLYYDSRPGKWRLTRGLGLTFSYLRQHIWNTYYYDPVDDNSFAQYDYFMQNYFFGAKILYSVGYDVFKNTTLFTTGGMRLLGVATKFQGHQFAPGFRDFNELATSSPQTWGSGTRDPEFLDWGFAFRGRLGGGASVRIFFLRLTGHVEGNYTYGIPVPRDKNGHFDLVAGQGWGYQGTVTADIAF